MVSSKNTGATAQSQVEPASVETITRSVEDGLVTAMSIPKKVVEANLDTGAELLTFMSRRMKAQADLFNRVGHCHDINEAIKMQRTFWEKVSKDYSEEINHLAEIGRKNFHAFSGLMSPKSNGSDKPRSAM